mmetsp:Transcript_36119/g.103888  ORF Transcript_36119/g.103888 Transcript_36119/m.103888 type:complete len:341 (+) Transcript_36119:104-1126(+)
MDQQEGAFSPMSNADDVDGFGFRSEDPRSEEIRRNFSVSSCGERRNSISAAPVSDARLKDWKGPPVHPKSSEETARIKATIDRSDALQVLFGHLSSTDLDGIIGAMFLRTTQAGELIIRQGADGDFFYIVDSGVYDISVQRKADVPPERVMVASVGASFGELALMYNVPRAATVECAEAGALWCLEGEVFQMMLVTAENTRKSEYESFLTRVHLFSDLNTYEISKIGDCLTSELFDNGEDIVKQGDSESALYFLYEGECKAYILGDRGEVEVKQYTQQGEYFGELAMVTNEPRRATVRASGDGCVVLCLQSENAAISMDSIKTRVMQNLHNYPAYEAFFP